MKERMERRLARLRSEFEAGQAVMSDLEARQANLRGSLLRVSGAIQVLQEMLDQEAGVDGPSGQLPAAESAASRSL